MFKILVADDEKIIRKGIAAILNRDMEEEITCVEASNGLEALEQVEKEKPDLIITDISMPGCDGLEFIKQLKDSRYHVEVIILSGYENFEYAKKAMKLGVKDYVMKPINKKEFLELIREYIRNITNDRDHAREHVKRAIKTNRILEQVKRETLISLLQCKSNEEARAFLDKLKDLGVRFQSTLFICVMIEYEITGQNKEYMDFVAKNIIEEYFSGREEEHSYVVIAYAEGKTLILFEGMNPQTFTEVKATQLAECADLIEKFGRTKVFVGVGDIAYDLHYLHNSLRQALRAANFKIYGSGEKVYNYKTIEKGRQPEMPDHLVLLKEADGNPAVIWNAFDKILNALPGRYELEAMRKLYEEIRTYLEERGEGCFRLKDFSQLFHHIELKKQLKKGMEGLQEYKKHKILEDKSGGLIKEIIYYTDNHLTDDIDLNMIAERFGKTSGYISALFRKSTGRGFNEYITDKRIGIAKKLLADRSVPIQEISRLCGYPNAKYFSVVFKKVTGKTPKKFREEVEK